METNLSKLELRGERVQVPSAQADVRDRVETGKHKHTSNEE